MSCKTVKKSKFIETRNSFFRSKKKNITAFSVSLSLPPGILCTTVPIYNYFFNEYIFCCCNMIDKLYYVYIKNVKVGEDAKIFVT